MLTVTPTKLVVASITVTDTLSQHGGQLTVLRRGHPFVKVDLLLSDCTTVTCYFAQANNWYRFVMLVSGTLVYSIYRPLIMASRIFDSVALKSPFHES